MITQSPWNLADISYKLPSENTWNPSGSTCNYDDVWEFTSNSITIYNDENEEKVIGGMNGIGAKACNIFSKKFCKFTKNYVLYFKSTISDLFNLISFLKLFIISFTS